MIQGSDRQQDFIALHLFVYGRVQGVGFRAWAVSRAKRLNIAGWIRNSPDGSVELVVEGKKDILESYIDILQEGNGWSRTESISADRISYQGYTGFDIE